MLDGKEVCVAQTRKLVGKLDFAQMSVMEKVDGVALRPLYEMEMRGGGTLHKRARRVPEWRVKLLPVLAPG